MQNILHSLQYLYKIQCRLALCDVYKDAFDTLLLLLHKLTFKRNQLFYKTNMLQSTLIYSMLSRVMILSDGQYILLKGVGRKISMGGGATEKTIKPPSTLSVPWMKFRGVRSPAPRCWRPWSHPNNFVVPLSPIIWKF